MAVLSIASLDAAAFFGLDPCRAMLNNSTYTYTLNGYDNSLASTAGGSVGLAESGMIYFDGKGGFQTVATIAKTDETGSSSQSDETRSSGTVDTLRGCAAELTYASEDQGRLRLYLNPKANTFVASLFPRFGLSKSTVNGQGEFAGRGNLLPPPLSN
jgi:hypothetical protein